MQRLIEPEEEESESVALLRERTELLSAPQEAEALNATKAAENGTGFWEAVRSENPVLHKELRSLFFPAKQTLAQRRLQHSVGATVGIGIYAAVLLTMREILKGVPESDHVYVWYSLYGVLIGIQGLIPMVWLLTRLPGSISREREKQTWNALLLSRLSPETILSGKYAAGLLLSLTQLLFLLPLTALAAVQGKVSLLSMVSGGAVIVATSALLAMTSLYASWKQETTAKASSEAAWWMLGILFGAAGVWGVGNLLWSVGAYFATGSPGGVPMPDFLRVLLQRPAWINPIAALSLSTIPKDINFLISPLVMTLLPLVYLTFATTLTVRLGKKMVKNFWSAPRDFTG
jgi:hypothetical protein